MNRFKTITGQPNINMSLIQYLFIPVLSADFQKLISGIVQKSHEIMRSATATYLEAHTFLLHELRFDSSSLSSDGIAQKRMSESFAISGRLDAEYYQPKYDDLFSLLDRLPTKRLSAIVDMRKSIEPGSEYYGDEGIPFIRVSDISKTGIDTPSIKIPVTIVPSIEKLYPKKDTILFSKDGSVGIAYKMEEDIAAVTSGALLHLRVKNTAEVLPDYLALVLNSEIVQLQAERDTSGAIIQHWKPGDIENVIVPVLPYDVQSEIAQKVQESFSLRRQAEKLIETAVRAVEIAIEQDEAAAITYMEEQSKREGL